MTTHQEERIDWLIQGDPVIRHWVHRDLLCSNEQVIHDSRDAIANDGWGKALLELQDSEGTWGQGLYSPKWISTFYTCLLLKRLELPRHPAVILGLEVLLNANKAIDGGWGPQKTWNPSDTCVNGMLLSMLAYWDLEPSFQKSLVQHLLDVKMQDGGWNCRWHKGDHHSSFHTTLSVLEGLWAYHLHSDQNDLRILKGIEDGIEFLLMHNLYQSHRTGKTVDPRMIRLSFPPRWRYDILKALDLFTQMGRKKDHRMEPAIALIQQKKDKNGRWPLQQNHPGKSFFNLEEVGQPSRINTVRALRVLHWWESD